MTNLIVASDAEASGTGGGTEAFASGAGASYVGDTIIGFSDVSFPVVSPPWNTILNGAGASRMFVAWRLVTNDSRDAVPGYFNSGAIVVSGAIGSYTDSETGTSGGSLSLTGTGLAVLWQYAVDSDGNESTTTPSGFAKVTADDDNEGPSNTSPACELDSKTYTSGVSTTNPAVGNASAVAVLLGIVAGGTNYTATGTTSLTPRGAAPTGTVTLGTGQLLPGSTGRTVTVVPSGTVTTGTGAIIAGTTTPAAGVAPAGAVATATTLPGTPSITTLGVAPTGGVTAGSATPYTAAGTTAVSIGISPAGTATTGTGVVLTATTTITTAVPPAGAVRAPTTIPTTTILAVPAVTPSGAWTSITTAGITSITVTPAAPTWTIRAI